ncbi:MAG: DNA repair protein RadC [Oscillospiraceae bacterium]|nr:DNA repair protein RadC [Oscillospiraceae bacterium]
MKPEQVHQGHRERLRQEFISLGAESFSEVRALELLLFYAIPRRDTNPLAHALLEEFGSLDGVFSASVQDLCRVEGVGESIAVLIRLIPELYRKSDSVKKKRERKVIDSTASAALLARSCFAGEGSERFLLFCLDAKKQLKKQEEVSRGVVNSVTVDIRRTAELALKNGASACIVAHNHPDGDVLPSEEDHLVTRRLTEALAVLGIPLLDHIIVSGEETFSFLDAGLIS